MMQLSEKDLKTAINELFLIVIRIFQKIVFFSEYVSGLTIL